MYTYNNTDRWSVTKSLVVVRPGFQIFNPNQTGGFMPKSFYYSVCEDCEAWNLLLEARNSFENVDAYRYDMVDTTR